MAQSTRAQQSDQKANAACVKLNPFFPTPIGLEGDDVSDGKHDVHECVDKNFVFELAKRGHVHVFSSQVSVRDETIDMKGLKLPKGCEIEFIHAISGRREDRPEVSITFGWPEG